MKKTQEQISYNMSRIKSKDSAIELMLRKELWRRGLRYRKNADKIIGKPDIVFLSVKLSIFCDGELWHGFEWEEKGKTKHKTNQDYWHKKIERNIERDKKINQELLNQGWTVLRFWGKDIKKDVHACADLIESTIIKLKNRDDIIK